MTDEQRAALIFARAVSAMIEMEGMKAANKLREMNGDALAYDEGAFCNLIQNYGLEEAVIHEECCK